MAFFTFPRLCLSLLLLSSFCRDLFEIAFCTTFFFLELRLVIKNEVGNWNNRVEDTFNFRTILLESLKILEIERKFFTSTFHYRKDLWTKNFHWWNKIFNDIFVIEIKANKLIWPFPNWISPFQFHVILIQQKHKVKSYFSEIVPKTPFSGCCVKVFCL